MYVRHIGYGFAIYSALQIVVYSNNLIIITNNNINVLINAQNGYNTCCILLFFLTFSNFVIKSEISLYFGTNTYLLEFLIS